VLGWPVAALDVTLPTFALGGAACAKAELVATPNNDAHRTTAATMRGA
jgi:hypothetical protein